MKYKTKVIVGLYFILLCRKYAIAIECFRATSKTEYCEEKDYDKFQTPPNPPTDISIQLGNMVSIFMFLLKNLILLKTKKHTIIAPIREHDSSFLSFV